MSEKANSNKFEVVPENLCFGSEVITLFGAVFKVRRNK